MALTYTPEQERLRQELRAYFARLMTPERRAALATAEGEYGNGEAYRQVVRELGRDGWLVLSWPEEYGGRRGAGGARPPLPPPPPRGGGAGGYRRVAAGGSGRAGVPAPSRPVPGGPPTCGRGARGQRTPPSPPRAAGAKLLFPPGHSRPAGAPDLPAAPPPASPPILL